MRALLCAIPTILKKQFQEQAYRAYVTDALKAITENTAKYAGGSYMKGRYYDLENPKPAENRTGEEIVSQIKKKLARIGGGTTESI